MRKPEYRGGKVSRWPISPEEVELLRKHFLAYSAANSGAWLALRSATIVSVMAYAGLRPEEVMGLKRRAYDDRARVLVVEDVFAADHREGDTKTHQDRVVSLLDPVVEDLRLWTDVLGDDNPAGWLFPPMPGRPVTRWTHRNWADRPWTSRRDDAVRERPEFADTLGQLTPAGLRTTFVSLLARARRPDAEIAEEAGHSIQTLRKHYLRVIKTMRRVPELSEVEWINQARAAYKTPAVAQSLRRSLLGQQAAVKSPVVSAKSVPAGEMRL